MAVTGTLTPDHGLSRDGKQWVRAGNFKELRFQQTLPTHHSPIEQSVTSHESPFGKVGRSATSGSRESDSPSFEATSTERPTKSGTAIAPRRQRLRLARATHLFFLFSVLYMAVFGHFWRSSGPSFNVFSPLIGVFILLAFAGVLLIPQAYFLKWAAAFTIGFNLGFRKTYAICVSHAIVQFWFGIVFGITIMLAGIRAFPLDTTRLICLLALSASISLVVAAGVNAYAIKSEVTDRSIGLVAGLAVATCHLFIAVFTSILIGVPIALVVG